MKKCSGLVYLFLFSLLFSAAGARGLEEAGHTRCFEFKVGSPARNIFPPQQSSIGCYLRLGSEQTMAFLKEEGGPHILTSVLTDNNGQIQHFSKAAGEISLVKQKKLLVNPLPVPLSLEEALQSPDNLREVIDFKIFGQKFKKRLAKVLQNFQAKKLGTKKLKTIVVDDLESNFPAGSALASVEEFYLPEEKQPTDGYWWPHIGLPLANGPSSPMGKYDAYVKSVSGQNPDSVSWERSHHNSSVDWAGHCNGWASSSILRGYDDVNLNDEENGNIITSSDLQGLRAALSYCTSNAFYGTRYRGDNSEIKDIYAHNFHFVLKYYLKRLKKPVVADFLNSPPVDSDIISGYKFTYEKTDTEGKYLVTAELRVHKNSNTFVHEKRIASTHHRTYQYYLWKSQHGSATNGEWLEEANHPDFLWVPLKESRCGGENPRIQNKWIKHMLENLEHLLSK